MRYTVYIFMLLTLAACNNAKQPVDEHSKIDSTSIIEHEPTLAISCYWYAVKRDTVMFTMHQKGPVVTGDLMFNFFEKDLNNGTVIGQMKGDTIIVDYYFRSEGVMSKRQEIFLKKGTTLLRGSGEAEEKGGEWKYKDITKLNFNNALVLQKIDCEH